MGKSGGFNFAGFPHVIAGRVSGFPRERFAGIAAWSLPRCPHSPLPPMPRRTGPRASSITGIGSRRTLTDFDRSKIDIARGLRNALGVALPLAIGAMAGRVQPALVVATGALNVGFADSTEPYLPRVRRMLGACVLVSLAVFWGSLSGWDGGFGAGGSGALVLWRGDAREPGDPGRKHGGELPPASSWCLRAARSRWHEAVLCGLLALAGGLFQTGLSALFWTIRPYEPERLALASVF